MAQVEERRATVTTIDGIVYTNVRIAGAGNGSVAGLDLWILADDIGARWINTREIHSIVYGA